MANDPNIAGMSPDELAKLIAMNEKMKRGMQPPSPRPSIPSPNAIPPAPDVKTIPAITTPISASPTALPQQPTVPSPPPPSAAAKPPESTWQKIGHGFRVAGNIAGDILAPNEMALIPGTDLHKAWEQKREAGLAGSAAKTGLENEQAAGLKQGNEMTSFTPFGASEPIQLPWKSLGPALAAEQRAQSSTQNTESRGDTARDVANINTTGKKEIATEGNQTKKEIATEGNQTKEQIAAGANVSREKVAQLSNETRKLISAEHEAGANQRSAETQDPNKLTNAMKTMKQTAQATLPELDSALEETQKVKGMLGPTAGRWNDFWQGKVGAGDPAFAHYKDEIAFISTAVTLAHARGRMSNELFEHFQQMFNAGKQDADNMTQALTVAKEWLTGYANMGEGAPGTTTPHAGAGNAPPAGAHVRTYNPATGKIE